MNPALTATRIDWVSVAKSVSERAGRTYSANYCREVAINFRSSSIIKPILRELGVITADAKEETPDSEQQQGDNPVPVIPEEAKPYCDHRGMINWHAVVDAIKAEGIVPEDAIESCLFRFNLPGILAGGTDEFRVLPIMRRLKLDEVVSARRYRPDVGSSKRSHEQALQYAEDFDLDITTVPGTGPNGLVLKRDIVAYHRFLKAGKALPAVAYSLRV